MSYDIFVQDIPESASSVDDIPQDFVPSPLGSRQSIIDGILDVIPSADFSDPSWGRIDFEDWSIEVNIGEEEPCASFALHVRGGSRALGAVAAILERLGFRALDTSEGGIFSADRASIESFNRWRGYRNRVIGSDE